MPSLQGGITVPDALAGVVDPGRQPSSVRTVSEFDAISEEGRLFYNSPIFTVPGSGSYNLLVTTASDVETSARMEMQMRGPGTVDIFINPTISNPGTLAPNGNYNIGSTRTSNLVVRTGVTASDNGTKIGDLLILGSTQGAGFGASASTPAKVVLPPNYTFLIMFNNEEMGDVKATSIFSWYETPFL